MTGKKIQTYSDWLIRLVGLNFLWLLFSGLGLGFLGIFPASSALFACLRDYHRQGQIKVWLRFKDHFLASLFTSNLKGYSLLSLIALLWIDYRWLLSQRSLLTYLLALVLFLACLISCLGLLIFFALDVHYQVKFSAAILNPFRFICSYPKTSLAICGSLLLWSLVLYLIPGLGLFLGISLPTRIISYCVQVQLVKLDGGQVGHLLQKHEKYDKLYYL